MSDDDVEVILDLKRAFEKPFAEVREKLQNINIGCPHVHHAKLRGLDEGLERPDKLDDTKNFQFKKGNRDRKHLIAHW